MELQLHGGGSGSVQVSDDTFGQDFREALVHQVVTARPLAPGVEGGMGVDAAVEHLVGAVHDDEADGEGDADGRE